MKFRDKKYAYSYVLQDFLEMRGEEDEKKTTST